jgi:hypothetical protein
MAAVMVAGIWQWTQLSILSFVVFLNQVIVASENNFV